MFNSACVFHVLLSEVDFIDFCAPDNWNRTVKVVRGNTFDLWGDDGESKLMFVSYLSYLLCILVKAIGCIGLKQKPLFSELRIYPALLRIFVQHSDCAEKIIWPNYLNS